MSTRVKVIALLAIIVAIFAGGLAALYEWSRRQVIALAEQRLEQTRKEFEEYLTAAGRPLEMLARDSTYWDDLVDAIRTGDGGWAEKTFTPAHLASYRTNAVWVYRDDGTLFFTRNNLYADDLGQVPVPGLTMPRLFAADRFCHFFVNSGPGLLEVRGATIHPSNDSARRSPPRGYFFAARLWSNAHLEEISKFTQNGVRIVPASMRPARIEEEESRGRLAFSRPLAAWDGQPAARLTIVNDSQGVRALNTFAKRVFIWLVAFAAVLFVLLSGFLLTWVSRPLAAISRSLQAGDAAAIEPLAKGTSEFAKIARMISAFFSQRSALIREMDHGRIMEEALRRTEDRLRQSGKMEALGQLAGGIAHDFNNLLTGILGYAGLLQREVPPQSNASDYARQIEKAGEHAASLTQQLLAFSRKQLLEVKVVELNALVAGMEKLLQRVIGERVQLATRYDAKHSGVKVDPGQIQQVIMNLAVNARDAMPNGGRVQISTGERTLPEDDPEVDLPPARYLVLEVTDEGVGMDEETKEHMFEPFFSTKGVGKGTGLGLATVYGIITQSAGAITVSSEPGRGSTFRIYLPQAEGLIVSEAEPAEAIPRGRNSETILVAEDDQIVRDLMCNVLSEQGFNVLCAENGEEALQLHQENDGRIELLISDVVMPGMSGPELARVLTARCPELPVLYVSGYVGGEAESLLQEENGARVLQKPFGPEALLAQVRAILDQSVGG